MDVFSGGEGQSVVIPSKAENLRNVNGSSHGCVFLQGVNWQYYLVKLKM